MLAEIKKLYYDTRKEREPLWTKVLSRPPGAALAWILRDTPITPNQISFLALLVSFVGAGLTVGWLSHLGLVVAMLVYQVAHIIDCADGMLARLRGTSSKVGHLLDFWGDEVKAKFLLGAVAVRLYLVHDDVLYLLVGLVGVLLVSTAISMTTLMRRPEYTGEAELVEPADRPPPTRKSPLAKALGLVEWAARSVMNYPIYVVILAAFDAIEIYFWAYIGIYVIFVLRGGLSMLLKLGRPARR